jgi:hypothetical protein
LKQGYVQENQSKRYPRISAKIRQQYPEKSEQTEATSVVHFILTTIANTHVIVRKNTFVQMIIVNALVLGAEIMIVETVAQSIFRLNAAESIERRMYATDVLQRINATRTVTFTQQNSLTQLRAVDVLRRAEEFD